jgi:hypothetical protein
MCLGKFCVLEGYYYYYYYYYYYFYYFFFLLIPCRFPSHVALRDPKAGVSVDDPANGIPLAGEAKDPRAVRESSLPNNRAHIKQRLQELLRDLETVCGDAEGTRDVLRRHSQDRYEARTRDSNQGDFRLGPNLDGLDDEY